MNQKQAFLETLQLANERGMGHVDRLTPSTTIQHLTEMWATIVTEGDRFSDAKLGRWLGWAQASVVAANCGTLEEMKEINLRNSADDPSPPFCNQCGGPFTAEQGSDEQYGGHWDTCPNRWAAKDKRDQALVDDEVTLGMVKESPEFDLAQWFQCILLGHKWKWLVRLVWPDEDSPLTYGISPVAERCKRCGSRRELNMFRWMAFVQGNRSVVSWERGL